LSSHSAIPEEETGHISGSPSVLFAMLLPCGSLAGACCGCPPVLPAGTRIHDRIPMATTITAHDTMYFLLYFFFSICFHVFFLLHKKYCSAFKYNTHALQRPYKAVACHLPDI